MAQELKRTILYEVIKKKGGKVASLRKSRQSYSGSTEKGGLVEEKDSQTVPKRRGTGFGVCFAQQPLGSVSRRRSAFLRYVVAGLLLMVFAVSVVFVASKVDSRSPIAKEQQLAGLEVQTGQNDIDSPPIPELDTVRTDTEGSQPIIDKEIYIPVPEEEKPVHPAGNHVIVIATYKQGEDLVPVKEYFDRNGILTEIQERGDYYFLVTKEKLQSPRREGSDGYSALQRIKRVGAKYKAPPGYESFAPNLFQDAYGMRIR